MAKTKKIKLFEPFRIPSDDLHLIMSEGYGIFYPKDKKRRKRKRRR